MKLFASRTTTKLLNVSAVNTVQTGTSRRIRPSLKDEVALVDQDFRFHTTLSATGGTNSPGAQLVIEGSVDGTTWYPLANGTARAANDTVYTEVIDANNVVVPAHVRARLLLTGDTLPNTTAVVEVISNGDFSLV